MVFLAIPHMIASMHHVNNHGWRAIRCTPRLSEFYKCISIVPAETPGITKYGKSRQFILTQFFFHIDQTLFSVQMFYAHPPSAVIKVDTTCQSDQRNYIIALDEFDEFLFPTIILINNMRNYLGQLLQGSINR